MSHDHAPLLELKSITKIFPLGKSKFKALDNIDLKIKRGEILGVIGESGSGKSTIGKIILQLEKQSAGSVYYEGKEISSLKPKDFFPYRKKMQMIFQDPYASLNPRMTIEEIIGEGLHIHKLEDKFNAQERVKTLLKEVKLEPDMLWRYPHEFSGGQRQRIGIARALAVEPQLIVCDEPVSALDTATQKHIMELLLELKSSKNLTLIFISHDLHAVKNIADTVAVLQAGKIIEYGPKADLFQSPKHPFTQNLLACSKRKVSVTASEMSFGPKYWRGPGST